jgi:hypothetical protein
MDGQWNREENQLWKEKEISGHSNVRDSKKD